LDASPTLSSQLYTVSLIPNYTVQSIEQECFDCNHPQCGLMINLEYIGVWGTALSGAIPSEVRLMPSLTLLLVDDKALTGTILNLWQLSTPHMLSITNNALTGSIPKELCSVGSAAAEGGVVEVAGNDLTGGAFGNESCADILF